MNLSFHKMIVPETAYFESMARWYRDPAIKYAIRPNLLEADLPDMTVEEIAAGFGKNPTKQVFLVFDDDRLIGEVSLDTDFPMLSRNSVPSAWISIIIGEKDYWGRGVGTRAMTFLEETSRALGLSRIELGVFAFNEPALHLYRRLGYVEIGRHENFTWRPEQWYADIRMEKLL